MKAHNEMPIDELREAFNLSEAGILTWRIKHCRSVTVGSEVGTKSSLGYRDVCFRGVKYRVHRIIFAMTHGKWPDCHVDHINGIRDDNRSSNLREASNSENLRNRGKTRLNKSGLKGVSWCSHTNKWQVHICTNGQKVNLGRFSDLEEAGRAYAQAASSFHGQFAKAVTR